jgi:AcrR family transcriptional regulator
MKRQIARRGDIRDLILDGVDVLLGRFGYQKMTMDDLARQVGIGKGTIYLHFPSKEEVVLSHVDRIAERVLGRLRAIAGSADSAEDRIRQMLVTRVMFRFDSVVHYSQNLNDLLSAVREGLVARRAEHFLREAREFERVLRDGVRRGVLACPVARGTSRALVWCTNSLLPFSLAARELGERGDLEERVSRIADLLLRGLMIRPESPGRRGREPRRDMPKSKEVDDV